MEQYIQLRLGAVNAEVTYGAHDRRLPVELWHKLSVSIPSYREGQRETSGFAGKKRYQIITDGSCRA